MAWCVKFAASSHRFSAFRRSRMDSTQTATGTGADAYRQLIDIGIALSVERDSAKLMERILLEAKAFTNADAGTLYLNHEDRELTFQIVRNDTLNIALGGTSGGEIKFRPVPLFTETGKPNVYNVASCAAITGKTINVEDAYSDEDEWDFSGTKRFDDASGYHSQ